MEMLQTFVIRVELFAGSHIDDVAAEMCILADRVGVRCEASFNGVKLWARPGDDPRELIEAFYVENRKPAGVFKLAQAA